MIYSDFITFVKQSLQYSKLGLKLFNRDKKVTLYRYQKLKSVREAGKYTKEITIFYGRNYQLM